jgi:hypothetical protein
LYCLQAGIRTPIHAILAVLCFSRKKAKEADTGAKSPAAWPCIITTDRPLREITGDALTALMTANNPPTIFQRGTTLTRLRLDERGAPFIETMSDAALRGRLARVADWQKADPPEEVPPPMDAVRDLYALPEWPLPVLNGIVEAPVFGPDGTLVTTPGYNPAARLWFHLRSGSKLPEISTDPSRADVVRARSLLIDDLFCDFPFVDDAGRAHALAALLLPFVRPMIAGPTPLHLIDKPTPGSGASLMIDAIAIIATGRTADVMTQSDYEEEWRKRITAVLLRAPIYVLIDNLRRTLDSAAVSAAITAAVWSDRILGHSRIASVPVTCCWCATGNNVRLSNEIARRTVLIRLDPRVDQPWLRTDFRHPDLRRWARENRGDLLWAVLTLGQSWIAAGRPEPDVVALGNFEAWTAVVGGILQVAGVPGFLGNITDMYSRSDEEGRMWRAFLAAWWERHRAEPVQVGDLFALATEADLLGPVLGEKGERSQRSSLGRALMRMRDRVIGEGEVPFVVEFGERSDLTFSMVAHMFPAVKHPAIAIL